MCMSIHKRMKNDRTRLRKQGLKPVQVWVLDQRAPSIPDALREQVKSLDATDEREALDFVAEVAE